MYEGQLFNTSIVKERFYNVLITNLTVGGLVIEMDCTEVCVCVRACMCACALTLIQSCVCFHTCIYCTTISFDDLTYEVLFSYIHANLHTLAVQQ